MFLRLGKQALAKTALDFFLTKPLSTLSPSAERTAGYNHLQRANLLYTPEMLVIDNNWI